MSGRVARHFEAVGEGRVGAELGIRPVEHQQHPRRQGLVQAAQLRLADEGAGGIGGVGDEHKPGAFIDLRQHLVDIDAIGGLGRAAAPQPDWPWLPMA